MKRAITLGVGAFALAAMTLPAAAADLGARPIAKAPVAAPVAVYNWSGFYIGGHVGGLWSDKDWTEVTNPAVTRNLGSNEVSGFLAGGQIGFNWQVGAWVFGIEGQASWTDASSDHACRTSVFSGTLVTCSTDINWVGTVAGRIGYAFNNVLLYAKGGAAFADEDFTMTPTLAGTVLALSGVSTVGKTRTGWMVGAGVEWGFTPNWSAKIEYNFMDFGSETFAFADPVFGPTLVDIDQQVHVVKAGINYRFTWGPVY